MHMFKLHLHAPMAVREAAQNLRFGHYLMSFDSATIDGPDGVHHCPKTMLNLVQAEKQGIIISEGLNEY